MPNEQLAQVAAREVFVVGGGWKWKGDNSPTWIQPDPTAGESCSATCNGLENCRQEIARRMGIGLKGGSHEHCAVIQHIMQFPDLATADSRRYSGRANGIILLCALGAAKRASAPALARPTERRLNLDLGSANCPPPPNSRLAPVASRQSAAFRSGPARPIGGSSIDANLVADR